MARLTPLTRCRGNGHVLRAPRSGEGRSGEDGQIRRGQIRRGPIRRGQIRRGQIRRGQTRRGQIGRQACAETQAELIATQACAEGCAPALASMCRGLRSGASSPALAGPGFAPYGLRLLYVTQPQQLPPGHCHPDRGPRSRRPLCTSHDAGLRRCLSPRGAGPQPAKLHYHYRRRQSTGY